MDLPNSRLKSDAHSVQPIYFQRTVQDKESAESYYVTPDQ